MVLCILPLTIEKLYNNAVSVFKYWYSMKMFMGSSQNMYGCLYMYIQELCN
jgi:hypothetical protein